MRYIYIDAIVLSVEVVEKTGGGGGVTWAMVGVPQGEPKMAVRQTQIKCGQKHIASIDVCLKCTPVSLILLLAI